MQRIFIGLLCLSLVLPLHSQDPVEADFLGNWQNSNLPVTSWLNSIYNEVWGVTVNGLEIGVIGSTVGVHFINITDLQAVGEYPNTRVDGKAIGPNLVHRDYHDYKGYLYAVADEGESSLQVIDLSDLPNSTTVVYDSDEFIRRCHNIFIDSETEKLYALGGSTGGSQPFNLMILSLEDPENPEFIAKYPNSDLSIPYVHDAYIRNDTAYLNCGTSGFYVVDFTDPFNPELLGTMTDYVQEGYNHSGWLHPTEPIYYLADETHGKDLKVVDVSDFSDIQVLSTFNAGASDPSHIPHNLIVKGDYLYVSYYYDGLQVFDISDPLNPVRAQFYDTYPGANEAFYHGAWGVFPFFDSDKILISDMQSGLFVVKFGDAVINSNTALNKQLQLQVFPQPAQAEVQISLTVEQQQQMQLDLLDLNGRQVQAGQAVQIQAGQQQVQLPLAPQLPDGLYLLQLKGEHDFGAVKIMIRK